MKTKRKVDLKMKKIIILGIVLITTILSSCNNASGNYSSENNNYIEIRADKIRYEGHTYIFIYDKWNSHASGIVHDPDCSCNKKD